MEVIDGITITLGATTTGLVVKELLAWLRSRNQKTEISPTPLPVEGEISKKQPFVTVGECNRRMCEQGDRLTRIESEVKTSNAAVIAKLDEIDQRSEERAQKTHERLDPFIDELGAVRGKMEVIEKAALNATMGGKK